MAFASQYAPDFAIRIKGRKPPPAMRASIISIRYSSAVEGTDRVEIQLADPHQQWLEHPLLELYNDFSLSLGYAGSLSKMFDGEITGRQASFSGGSSTMTIEASDLSHRLMRTTKERSFGPLPDPAIVAFLAIENGLIPVMDAGAGAGAILSLLSSLLGKPRFQENMTDYDFLKKMASERNIHFSVEGKTLSFRVFQEFTPSQTLTWGRDLLDFSPRLSVVGQVQGVSVGIWLRELKLSLVATFGWDFDRNRFIVNVVPGIAAGAVPSTATFKFTTQPIKDPTKIPDMIYKAYSELKSKLNQRLQGSGSVVGNPDLHPGQLIKMEGVGSEFSGKYRIKDVTHSLDGSGYKTNFNVYREVIPEIFL